MVRLVPTSLALAILIATTTAFAQSPPPAPPASAPAAPPPAGPPGSPPPGSAAPGDTPPAAPQGHAPPGYYPAPGPPVYPPPGYPPPGYPPPGYDPYAPPPPPPPPEVPPKPLRWSLRYDPFDLLERRLTFEGEVALYKFLALEVVPSWIFGSPYSGIDGKGFAISGRVVFYLSGEALRGLWLKASFGYENYSATFTNPGDPTDVTTPQRLASGIIGVLFGDTWVIPRAGGFALSGGIGLAIATANKVTLTTNGSSIAPAAQTTLYDGFDKVRPLGTVGVGVAF